MSKFDGLVHLAPPVNHPEDPLTVVVEAFSRDPGAGAIFIVDGDDHLLGCIREEALDADVVRLILPQRLWSTIDDMDTRTVLRAARGPRLTARDLMEAYCETFVTKRTAERLGVHRNTVLYRLKRIEEITSSDLDDGPTRLLIQFGLLAGRLLRKGSGVQQSTSAAWANAPPLKAAV